MPLAELQSALGIMIAVQAATGQVPVVTQTTLDRLALSREERAWLAMLPPSRGFQVSCDIQRWWRETRLRETARLTLAALGTESARAMLTAYLSANLCNSLFFLPEATAFLQFVSHNTDHPHTSAVAQFEHALLVARETAARQPEKQLIKDEEKADFTQIIFAAPPEEILAALLHGQPLPEVQVERYPVLVSPAFPYLWRPA